MERTITQYIHIQQEKKFLYIDSKKKKIFFAQFTIQLKKNFQNKTTQISLSTIIHKTKQLSHSLKLHLQ